MITINGLDYTSPALLGDAPINPHRELEILSAAVWLWMQALAQGDRQLRAARHLLLPAIKSGQYLLGSEAGKSVFYMTWANLSPDAEARYIQYAGGAGLQAADWMSGNRTWIIDWIAPFGHSLYAHAAIRQHLWRDGMARSLCKCKADQDQHVMTHYGENISQQMAQDYFEQRPLATLEATA